MSHTSSSSKTSYWKGNRACAEIREQSSFREHLEIALVPFNVQQPPNENK